MNISTYEARIKALEDQLNPPGPAVSGLLSVVVNPEITLADTTSLNAKISEMMPIEPSNDPMFIRETLLAGALVAGNVYNVSVTPSPDWYAVISAGPDPFISDTPGMTITNGITAVQDENYITLNVTVLASETGTEEGSSATLVLQLKSPTA